MFHSKIIDKQDYNVKTMHIASIIVVFKYNSIFFYGKNEQIIHKLDCFHINNAAIEKDIIYVLQNKTCINTYLIENYDDISCDVELTSLTIKKISSVNLDDHCSYLMKHKIGNINTLFYLTLSQDFIVLSNLCGDVLILEKKTSLFCRKYKFSAIILDIKAEKNFLFILSKSNNLYHISKFNILHEHKNTGPACDSIININEKQYMFNDVCSYSFHVNRSHKILPVNDKLVIFSENSISIYRDFVKLFSVDKGIFVNKYTSFQTNKILIIDIHNIEHVLEITSGKIIDRDDLLKIKQVQDIFNVMHKCKAMLSSKQIKSAYSYYQEGSINFIYFNGHIQKETLKEKQKKQEMEFVHNILDYFVQSSVFFVVTERLHVFTANMLKKKDKTYKKYVNEKETIVKYVKIAQNITSDLKNLKDLMLIREHLILVFDKFITIDTKVHYIEYTCYDFDDSSIVFCDKNNLFLLSLKAYERVHDNTFETFVFNFIVLEIAIYKACFVLLTGDKIIRIYNYRKRKFSFVQFFRSNISTLFVIKNNAFIMSGNMLKFRITGKYNLVFKKRIVVNSRYISKKSYTSKHNKKVILFFKQNESYKYLLFEKHKVLQVQNDEIYLSGYIFKFYKDKICIYKDAQQYEIESSSYLVPQNTSSIHSVVFKHNLTVINYLNNIYSI